LLEAVKHFRFHSILSSWIRLIPKSAMLSIRFNHNLASYFSYSRGVRQEAPLSPLLFCIAEAVFSRAITLKIDNQKMLSMASSKGCPFASHNLYADDVLVFCRADRNL